MEAAGSGGSDAVGGAAASVDIGRTGGSNDPDVPATGNDGARLPVVPARLPSRRRS
jgi:hypothetical protein